MKEIDYTVSIDTTESAPSGSTLFGQPVPESVEAADEDRFRARRELRVFFAPLFGDTGGIDSWLDEDTPQEVFERLYRIDAEPLSRVQLNQLLVLSSEAGVSDGFFTYYWLSAPEHPYDVRSVPGYSGQWTTAQGIRSLGHLKWGLYRFYMDALLYFGNIRSAYRFLRELAESDVRSFFAGFRVDTASLANRGAPIALRQIAKDDRYLISEMACKSFAAPDENLPEIMQALQRAYAEHRRKAGRLTTIRALLSDEYLDAEYSDRQQQFVFSADELLDQEIHNEDELAENIAKLFSTFNRARMAALENTALYLSMAEDLDVYVATSMRTRQDFRDMANFCEEVFNQAGLPQLDIRYFDPTLSAAEGHEDKGLIECLMVKCAKVLIYSAGSKESWGKDAEAAMALSLGKPVIFYCDDEQRKRFLRDLHPLTRLIEFRSGVPIGAMVASDVGTVAELLARIFENRLEYDIEQPKPGYLKLRERRTKSVVRLQTSDGLLRETFWNYYHRKTDGPRFPGVGAPVSR